MSFDSKDAEADPTFLAMALEDARVLVDREGVWPRVTPSRSCPYVCAAVRPDEERKRRALARADRFLARQPMIREGSSRPAV